MRNSHAHWNIVARACTWPWLAVAMAGPLILPPRAVAAQESARELNDRIRALERDVRSLKENVAALNDVLPLPIVWLDCETKRFTWLKLENGLSFAAICEKVEPYEDGHRVHVKIGNPYAASFGGFSGTLWHGATPLNPRRSAMTLPGLVEPGQWHRVVVAVSPSKLADLQAIGVEIDVNTVGLREP